MTERDRLTEDGKTMDEEARDSAQMLGGVLLASLAFWGGLALWFFCG